MTLGNKFKNERYDFEIGFNTILLLIITTLIFSSCNEYVDVDSYCPDENKFCFIAGSADVHYVLQRNFSRESLIPKKTEYHWDLIASACEYIKSNNLQKSGLQTLEFHSSAIGFPVSLDPDTFDWEKINNSNFARFIISDFPNSIILVINPKLKEKIHYYKYKLTTRNFNLIDFKLLDEGRTYVE